jgi:threonine synthase
VKKTLKDSAIKVNGYLSTANSINIGRLLPQIVYYFWGVAQLKKPANIVVPSGNFGNITACAYAKALGAPIHKIIAATNSNDVIPEFLKSGVLTIRPSRMTLSNAMDVGNPNNFSRLQYLYQDKIRDALLGAAVTDDEILDEIKTTYVKTQYILDPHTAVGVHVARQYADFPTIIAATAHPGKFPGVIKKALDVEIPLPTVLKEALAKEKRSIPIPADYEVWKKFFLDHLQAS